MAGGGEEGVHIVLLPEALGGDSLAPPAQHYTIDKEKFKSNSRNTPFDGWEVQCRVKLTMVGGKIVYHE